MSNVPSSHSEAFGLKGQDEAGPANKLGKTQDPPAEGQGVLGDAGHPTGGAPAESTQQNIPGEGNVGRTGDEGVVGGMKQGSSDNTAPGAGSSTLMPSQGSGNVSDDHSTAGVVTGNPEK